MPPAKKSASQRAEAKKPSSLDVLFGQEARQFLFFNRYRVEEQDSFVFLLLSYVCLKRGTTFPVFQGCISKDDLALGIDSFKEYLSKIGLPDDSLLDNQGDFSSAGAPVSFHYIGLSAHGDTGEIVIQQIVRKYALDATRQGAENMQGTTHGCYASSITLHKSLVLELIEMVK